MANSAWKSDKCYRVLTNLLKDGKAKFANESNMVKVFAKGYDINSLHEAGLQVDRTISAMTMFKKLIESEKKRLETKDRVCITPRPTCNYKCYYDNDLIPFFFCFDLLQLHEKQTVAKLVEAEDEEHLNDLVTKPKLFAVTDSQDTNPETAPMDAENSEDFII